MVFFGCVPTPFTVALIPCSRQKRFVVDMQLKQCFARAKPFPIEKKTKKPDFF